MLTIRFTRIGKKNQPIFRIVVIEKKSPPKAGRPLEILGFYNPLTKEKAIKKERILYWKSVGAQVSDSVKNLLINEGIIKDKKIPVHNKPKAKKEEEKKQEKQEKQEKPKETEEIKPTSEEKTAPDSEAKEEKE